MCTPECIIAMLGCPVLNEAVKEAVKAVTKARKYVRQYRMHVDNLRTELRHLEDARVIIERRVREARDRGEEIENAVIHWQANAGQMVNDVQELVGQVEARMHCFSCSCPNIKWRYQLGKQAEEKIRDVQRLVKDNHFEEISHPKPPPSELEFPSAENYVHLDSRTPIFEQIVVALKDPNVKMIGVHGLGGVGKTTLVEKVAKEMLNDGTFKQIPLAAVSKVLNVNEIQKKLADELNILLDARADKKANANQLWHKFKNGDKYLVILDDIWGMVDLNAIGIPITDGQIGCKVVLTSRNKDLLEINMKADRNFPIQELSEVEAWNLFKKEVGNSMESQPGMEVIGILLIIFICRKIAETIHSELKTREEKKNEMAVEHPMKIDSSFNNSSIQMNGSTDHVNSDFTLNRGSPSGSGSREAGNSGLRGLDNLGNTCFMNSAIQCLVHTSELVDHFKDYQKDIYTEESSGMKGELAFQFGDLLRKLRAPEAGPVSPEEFKSKLAAIDRRFNDGNQHDSQEFLAFLLNELHEDLNCATCKPIEAIDVEGRPDEAESNKHWSNHLSCNTSIIVDLFHGQCQSKLVCPVYETKSSTFERFQDLSLPLPPTESESDTITLDQCLQTYLQEEILGQKDEWNCPNCKTDQPANKKLDLWRLPKILIIHLRRFSNKKKKLETFVDFPIDDFDLSGIVRNSQQSHHYILYAVINHYGDMGGGHYTAYVEHGGDQWYEFDDRRVSPVAEHQIKSSAAYVLFYRRKADV